MSEFDGEYNVNFSADIPGIGGTIQLRNGTATGHDRNGGNFRYNGTYKVVGNTISAIITVTTANPQAISTFNTIGRNFSLELTGSISTDGFEMAGPSPFGGAQFTVTGRPLPKVQGRPC